jgi:hypothetical protein
VAVCGHLDAIGEPSREIVHEVVSGLGIPVADVPAGDKLGFSVNRRPRPNVAPAFAFFSAGTFLSFAPTKDQISSHWTRLQVRLRKALS